MFFYFFRLYIKSLKKMMESGNRTGDILERKNMALSKKIVLNNN